jgi:hypothetical protein
MESMKLTQLKHRAMVAALVRTVAAHKLNDVGDYTCKSTSVIMLSTQIKSNQSRRRTYTIRYMGLGRT